MSVLQFDGIGTKWRIDFYDSSLDKKLGYIQLLIQKRIEEFERMYSRFRYDSFINITLNQVGTFTLPPDAELLFSLYYKLYKITGGAFTPFIGQVLVDAGYDALYSLKAGTLHTPPHWDDVMEYQYPKITIKKPEVLDFGAGGKGYLIDIISELLKEEGVREFCIDAGGDIRYEHSKPLRVGLENPNNLEQAIGIVTIANTSLCASAGSRRKWDVYHHIIDPRTLSSPEKVIATWVIAPKTIVADVLATCLFLVEPSLLTPHFLFEYLIVHNDLSFEKSSAFPAELFLQKPY
jgi:thiamine biosynthesis lipoprotein